MFTRSQTIFDVGSFEAPGLIPQRMLEFIRTRDGVAAGTQTGVRYIICNTTQVISRSTCCSSNGKTLELFKSAHVD